MGTHWWSSTISGTPLGLLRADPWSPGRSTGGPRRVLRAPTESYGLLRFGSAECGGPGGGGGGYASRGRRNRLLPKDAQYPLGTADLKWLPPHSADPLPQFQFRDCGFVVSGTGFQNFRLRSVGISIFPALELPDFKISSFGASRFQYFRLRSSSGASKSGFVGGLGGPKGVLRGAREGA